MFLHFNVIFDKYPKMESINHNTLHLSSISPLNLGDLLNLFPSVSYQSNNDPLSPLCCHTYLPPTFKITISYFMTNSSIAS